MSHFKCYYYNIQVVYPNLRFILCIDSLHFSNVDEVNCIWLDTSILYVVHGYTINTYLLGCICVAKATINQSSQQISSCEWKHHDSVNVYIQFNNTTPIIGYCLC